MIVRVADLLEPTQGLKGQYEGREVEIEARVFVPYSSFIADDPDAFLRGERILVLDDGAIKHCLYGALPASGGGAYVFDEAIKIRGVAFTKDNEAALRPIGECVINPGPNEIYVTLEKAGG